MKLRKFFNEYLLPNIKRCSKPNYHKQQLFFFQIGCFPSNNNNINQEYPDVISKYQDKYKNIELNLVLIDPKYDSLRHNLDDENSIFYTAHDRINNYDLNTYIFEESIDNDEYISLIEFCHFISFYKCLSIIMEFTGIKRLASLKKDNITDYLYITPSDCLIDTKEIIYKPIIYKKIEFKGNKDKCYYYFHRLENISNLVDKNLKIEFFEDKDSDEYLFLECILKNRIKMLEDVYRKLLIYLKTPPPDNHMINNFNFKLEYKKSNIHISYLYDILKIRMAGYYYNETEIILKEFINSSYQDLETFINKKISQIILDCLKFKYENDETKINENYDLLIFDNSNKLKNIINNLHLKFNI